MRRVAWLLLGLSLSACGTLAPTVPPPASSTPRPAASRTPTVTATATASPAATAGTGSTSPTPDSATAQPATPGSPPPAVTTVVERGRLAPGFSLTIYARVPAPSSLAFGPDGRLYAASTNGVVYALADADGDHVAETMTTYATDVPMPLGLAWVGDDLYISYIGRVKAVTDSDGDGDIDTNRRVLSNLPGYGLHQNDGLALGPDGYLYLGMGSTCDHCREADPRSGSILRFRPDGSELTVFASGLRNPYDVAFNARGDLFATDNSRDDLGPSLPPEELNHIEAGEHYGWPECWVGNEAPLCSQRRGPVATFTAHTSANGLVFYHGQQFPAAYFGDAFVAITGSIYLFPEDPERGVARVRLTPSGTTYVGEVEWFLELPDGRPVDVTVGPDGGLYVADYTEGMVYRIVYGEP